MYRNEDAYEVASGRWWLGAMWPLSVTQGCAHSPSEVMNMDHQGTVTTAFHLKDLDHVSLAVVLLQPSRLWFFDDRSLHPLTQHHWRGMALVAG